MRVLGMGRRRVGGQVGPWCKEQEVGKALSCGPSCTPLRIPSDPTSVLCLTCFCGLCLISLQLRVGARWWKPLARPSGAWTGQATWAWPCLVGARTTRLGSWACTPTAQQRTLPPWTLGHASELGLRRGVCVWGGGSGGPAICSCT